MVRKITEFVDVETARRARGLRLVTVGGVPSPWSEAAKGIFDIKNLPFVAVRLMGRDEDIRTWTGMSNAPAVLYDDERVRSGWSEILALAERLAPDPSLVPRDADLRAEMFGWSHEILGENGLLWSSRLMAVDSGLATEGARGFPVPVARYLGKKYGYDKDCIRDAAERAQADLDALARCLSKRGPYFFGNQLSALDVYSAAAMGILAPLPDAECAMVPMVRAAFESMRGDLTIAPLLLEHRDRVYREHLTLPVTV